MLQEPVLSTLLKMAAPNIGEAVARVAFIGFDAIFIGWLGTEALAGVSLVFPIFLVMQMMSASGLGTGVCAAVARALGSGRKEDANKIAAQGLMLAIIIAGLFSLTFLSFGPTLYEWMGATGESLKAASEYSAFVFGGIILVWLMNVLANIARGTGTMIVPASAIIIGECFHLALAPVLILGIGPFPQMGVRGAAIAILASYGIGAFLLFIYFMSRKGLVSFQIQAFKFSISHMREIAGIGMGASLNVLQSQLIIIVTTALMASYSQTVLAGFGVANRLELLQIPVTFALGSVVITMITTNLGAGRWERVIRIVYAGVAIAFGIGVMFGITAIVLANHWMALFSKDPSVIEAGVLYLSRVGFMLPILGVGFGLTFALLGINKPLLPFFAINIRLLIIVMVACPLVIFLKISSSSLIFIIQAAMVAFSATLLVASFKLFNKKMRI